jgi:predicted hotdog family 3-hydroxylacyl-ACP dehydratase
MAQAAAAYAGLLAGLEGRQPPEAGYLLGTRKFTSQRQVFLKHEELKVAAEMIFRGDTGLCAFECEILQDTTVIAGATINVYEPPAGTLSIQRTTD